MNVKEYLEATNGTTTVTAVHNDDDGWNGQDTGGSSDMEDLSDAYSNANDDDNNDMTHLNQWEDITSSFLYGDLSDHLGVTYLSLLLEVEDETHDEQNSIHNNVLHGEILAPKHRFVISIPCRRDISCPPGVNVESVMMPPFRHVFFVLDTSSPKSYLSVEAMQALSATSNNDDTGNNDDLSTGTIPDVMDVQFRVGRSDNTYDAKFEFLLSPGNCSEVNILGGNVLAMANISSNAREKTFSLQFLP